MSPERASHIHNYPQFSEKSTHGTGKRHIGNLFADYQNVTRRVGQRVAHGLQKRHVRSTLSAWKRLKGTTGISDKLSTLKLTFSLLCKYNVSLKTIMKSMVDQFGIFGDLDSAMIALVKTLKHKAIVPDGK
jgi:hypothetical protein